MALLSVAIYDATVAAWDSKYAYNRLRPTVVDPSLMAALPNPQSPSYPSEHATVVGAASTVLAYLFPDRADDFKARARESAQVWVQAGLQYPSDVAAGMELGQTGPPPDCRSPQGQTELAEVRNYPRTFETNAAAFYWQSGRSNWNNVIDQKIFEYRLDLNPPRVARVYALAYIAASMRRLRAGTQNILTGRSRPFMLGVTPLFPTPNHPSYRAAHGCFSGSISAVLAKGSKAQ